jgi:hypothetical protein
VRAVDVVAGAIIASVAMLCVGAVVFSAREAGRSAGRRLTRRPPAPRDPLAQPHRRPAGHPTPDATRRRERAAARPRRRD